VCPSFSASPSVLGNRKPDQVPKMDAMQVYIRRRDAKRMASAPPGMNLTYLQLFVIGFHLVIQLT